MTHMLRLCFHGPLRWLLTLPIAFAPTVAFAHPDPDAFAGAALVTAPAMVDCTLEDGTEAQCHELTVSALP